MEEVPVSDDVAKSGADDGVLGAAVSMVRDNAELATDVLPARSVSVEVTLHTPSLNAGKSQLVAGMT